MTDHPTITADEARVGDTLRLTVEGPQSGYVQGVCYKTWDGALAVVDRIIDQHGTVRIQRVQAAPRPLPTEPGSKIAYPDGETWTLNGHGDMWYLDGTSRRGTHPSEMRPGWVEVKAVPAAALDELRAAVDDALCNEIVGKAMFDAAIAITRWPNDR